MGIGGEEGRRREGNCDRPHWAAPDTVVIAGCRDWGEGERGERVQGYGVRWLAVAAEEELHGVTRVGGSDEGHEVSEEGEGEDEGGSEVGGHGEW